VAPCHGATDGLPTFITKQSRYAAKQARRRAAAQKRPSRGGRDEPQQVQSGTVKWFNPAKGCGFINGGLPDAYVDIKAVEKAGLATLDKGTQLNFVLEPGTEGPSEGGTTGSREWCEHARAGRQKVRLRKAPSYFTTTPRDSGSSPRTPAAGTSRPRF